MCLRDRLINTIHRERKRGNERLSATACTEHTLKDGHNAGERLHTAAPDRHSTSFPQTLVHFEPGFPRIRARAGRIHGRLEAPCDEQPEAEPLAVRRLWFIFNNSISLPRGTVKAEVLSARNPESKKSQHIAKSSSDLSLCAIKERMGESEEKKQGK